MSVAADMLLESLDSRTRELLAVRARSGAIRRRGSLIRRALLVADLAGLTAAFAFAHMIYAHVNQRGALSGSAEIGVFAASLPMWVLVAKLYGLYDRDDERTDHSTADDFSGVFHLVTIGTFLLIVVGNQTGWIASDPQKILDFWIFAIVGVTLSRIAGRGYCRRQIGYLQNAIVVGAGDVGQTVALKLLTHPEYGINLVGFVDADPMPVREELEHVAVLGHPHELDRLVGLLDVERVIVAFSSDSVEETLTVMRVLGDLDVQVDVVPRLFEALGPHVDIRMLEGLPLVGLPPARMSRSAAILKRGVDVGLSVCGLIVAAPVLAAIALAVRIDSPGPVFYSHGRVGRGRQSIGVLKFRTMYREASRGAKYGGELAEELFRTIMEDPANAAEFAKDQKLKQDPRVTRVGRFLRRTSLDELPQLVNVLRGELSLVGPRAITLDELRRYGSAEAELLSVRPGITGYWQVNGRSRLSYEDRIRLDLSYIRGWSLRLDIQILARTLRALTVHDAY